MSSVGASFQTQVDLTGEKHLMRIDMLNKCSLYGCKLFVFRRETVFGPIYVIESNSQQIKTRSSVAHLISKIR